MIRVKKIAHAIYEMPDVDKQTEYYTEVLGLTITGKDKDAVYLASTVDHHSVVLRKGSKPDRTEEHTTELQSRPQTACRPLLEKKIERKSLQRNYTFKLVI